MAVLFNIRHVEHQNVNLRGELPAAELEWEEADECIQLRDPVCYNLEVQQVENAYLVRGQVQLGLDCTCVRCLKSFRQELSFADWTCLLTPEGEEAVSIVNDCIDLTPYLREDILLAFPQHPLCEPGCPGLGDSILASGRPASGAKKDEGESSAWAELDKLKL